MEKFEATTFLKMAREPLQIDLDLCEEEPSIFAEENANYAAQLLSVHSERSASHLKNVLFSNAEKIIINLDDIRRTTTTTAAATRSTTVVTASATLDTGDTDDYK